MESRQPIFPWYKERLQTKYLKPSTTKLSTLTWHKAIDDSTPAPSWTKGGISPIIYTSNSNHHGSSTSIKVPQQIVSKKHACFSRQMIQKQRRREYVAAVEDQLIKHPLAQHQHYRDSMPAEMFDKILSVLYTDSSSKNVNSHPFAHAESKNEKNCSNK